MKMRPIEDLDRGLSPSWSLPIFGGTFSLFSSSMSPVPYTGKPSLGRRPLLALTFGSSTCSWLFGTASADDEEDAEDGDDDVDTDNGDGDSTEDGDDEDDVGESSNGMKFNFSLLASSVSSWRGSPSWWGDGERLGGIPPTCLAKSEAILAIVEAAGRRPRRRGLPLWLNSWVAEDGS